MQRKVFIGVIVFFALLPFFWLPQGTLDLGGDSTRLFFWDPYSYLINTSLYYISPEGIGTVEPSFYGIPFFLSLIFLKLLLPSSLLIILFNSLKLILAFVGIYLISLELLKDLNVKNKTSAFYASLLGGLLYVFMSTMTGNWDRALLSHNQVFVNPISFYLIFMYVKTSRRKFMYIFLTFSLVFSASFGYTSAPAFFSFFPIAVLFILIYVFIYKIRIKKIELCLFVVLFLILQAFHILPQLITLIDAGSYSNTRVFNRESIAHEGVRYFLALLPFSKTSNYIFLTYGSKMITSVVVPLIILIGLIISRKSKLLLLLCLFFITTLFLLSGNITTVGSKFYESFFYIPGFSMFRNFMGQWLFVFSFFYAILFALTSALVFNKLPKKIFYGGVLLIVLCIVLPARDFITGDSVNRIILTKTNTRIADTLDGDFLKTLNFVKQLPGESKIINLPLTDAGYQFVPGKNKRGAYLSVSFFATIAGRNDFSGYRNLEPFAEDFLKYSKDKDFKNLLLLLRNLNIEYLVYNEDPFVLDDSDQSMYTYMNQFLPNNQNEYRTFINNLKANRIAKFGYYEIYRLPLSKIRTIYSSESFPNITYTKINPTKYKISVKNAKKPYNLIFLSAYHASWKLRIEEKNNSFIEIRNHFLANSYANGWKIYPNNTGAENYNMVLNNDNQNYFYIGCIITIGGILILIFCVISDRKKY